MVEQPENYTRYECCGMVIDVDVNGNGNLVTQLDREDLDERCESDRKILAMLDAVESMVLAHACANVDVDSPEYVEGVTTALNAIEQQVVDDVEADYAVVAWRAGDVVDTYDVSHDQACIFLEANESEIQERLIEFGHGVLDTLAALEGWERVDDR